MSPTVRRRHYGAVHVHPGQFTQAEYRPKHVQLAKIDMAEQRIMVLDYAGKMAWIVMEVLPKNWLCECASDQIQLFGGLHDGAITTIPAALDSWRVPIIEHSIVLMDTTPAPELDPVRYLTYTRTDLWRARLVAPTKEKK